MSRPSTLLPRSSICTWLDNCARSSKRRSCQCLASEETAIMVRETLCVKSRGGRCRHGVTVDRLVSVFAAQLFFSAWAASTQFPGIDPLQSIYVFDFLATVSAQLKERLENMDESVLDDLALRELSVFQDKSDSRQGVYVLHYDGAPVYLGKANNVSARLFQHLEKLSGRQHIDRSLIGYKALLLDKSMSTAANENILIAMFKEQHAAMWNGNGFGPKDPGQERDTTKPGWFDKNYPIIEDYAVKLDLDLDLDGGIALRSLFAQMKTQLPYVFRYDVPAAELEQRVPLAGVNHDARSLLQAAVTLLGAGWKGAVISYGMVLYKTNKEYRFGVELTP